MRLRPPAQGPFRALQSGGVAILLFGAVALGMVACGSSSSSSSISESSSAVTSVQGTPASVNPSAPSPTGLRASMADVLLIHRGGAAMEACVGAVIATAPPQCAVAVEVRGVDWADVPWSMSDQGTRWAQVTLTGEYHNGVISARAVAPVSTSAGVVNRAREQLCQTPSGSEPSVLPPDVDLAAVLSREDGFQGAWVSTTAGLTVFNIASVGDRERVERLIRKSYSGLLCVGPVAGPTHAHLMSATERLQAHSEQLGLVSTSSWVNGDGARLHVHVVTAAPNVVHRVEQIVGPGVAPAIDLTAVFH